MQINIFSMRLARSLLSLLLFMQLAGCAPVSDKKILGINVRGSVSVHPTEFSGYYVYQDDAGNDVRKSMSGSGNFNEVVQGSMVRLAAVRRTSTQGVIGLVITSNGKVVYDSGMLQTNDLIIYEAPEP